VRVAGDVKGRKMMREFTLLKTRKAEALLDEIEQIQKRVTERAYELFRNRGAALGAAVNDWLAAERTVPQLGRRRPTGDLGLRDIHSSP
jgi:hypothetical protein